MRERTLEFAMVLDGVRPKGQGRPRFSPHGHAYTPPNTRAYLKLLRSEIKNRWGDRTPLAGAVAVSIDAAFQLPKRARDRPFHVQRPDADNLAKAALDALNGVVFGDDAQVVELHARKAWSVSGHCLQITVWSLA